MQGEMHARVRGCTLVTSSVQLQTADASDATEELQRVCFENAARRRDAEAFEAFKPLVIAVELKQDVLQQHSPGSASEDDYSVSAAAATIGRGDRMSMRRILAGFISGPAAAAAAKRSLQLQRREVGTFITHSDVPAASKPPSLSPPPPSSAASHVHLQNHITSHILSYCASLSPSPPSSSHPPLTAAIARMQLAHSLPVITCAPLPLLHGILTAAVALCDAKVTEKSGCGAESYELQGDWGEGGGGQMVFPVKLLLCCKADSVRRCMTGVVACFMEGWVVPAVGCSRKFVGVYVDVAGLGSDVGCLDVLRCVVLQVREDRFFCCSCCLFCAASASCAT